jgi:hypothetical protein
MIYKSTLLNTSNAYVTDGDKTLFPFILNITKKPQTNNFTFQAEGKICSLKSYPDLADCISQSESYANSLILLIRDVPTMNAVHDWETANWDEADFIKAHILHESIKDEEKYEGKISFWVDDDLYTNLRIYDFRAEKANYFLKIDCKYIFSLR